MVKLLIFSDKSVLCFYRDMGWWGFECSKCHHSRHIEATLLFDLFWDHRVVSVFLIREVFDTVHSLHLLGSLYHRIVARSDSLTEWEFHAGLAVILLGDIFWELHDTVSLIFFFHESEEELMSLEGVDTVYELIEVLLIIVSELSSWDDFVVVFFFGICAWVMWYSSRSPL